MEYGKKLKELRLEKNLSEEQIASIIGVSRITYSHYEVQEKIIPLKRLVSLCNYYRTSIDYVLGLTNKKDYASPYNELNSKEIGKRLKIWRKENKITQEKLALSIGTVHPTITNYENGKNLIATAFLYNICIKYNVSADYFLGEFDKPKYLTK